MDLLVTLRLWPAILGGDRPFAMTVTLSTGIAWVKAGDHSRSKCAAQPACLAVCCLAVCLSQIGALIADPVLLSELYAGTAQIAGVHLKPCVPVRFRMGKAGLSARGAVPCFDPCLFCGYSATSGRDRVRRAGRKAANRRDLSAAAVQAQPLLADAVIPPRRSSLQALPFACRKNPPSRRPRQIPF